MTTRALAPSDYRCTMMIGFSVTAEFWPAFYAAIPNPAQWEMRWISGGSVDLYADSGYAGWTEALINPVAVNPEDPDRVILNVSGVSASLHLPGGYTKDVSEWRGYISNAISNIRAKFPNVRMILLQPNVAGPNLATCPISDPNATPYDVIRNTYTSPYIRTAIASLSSGNVRFGYTPRAVDCSDFTDWAGHMTVGARDALGVATANYYANNI